MLESLTYRELPEGDGTARALQQGELLHRTFRPDMPSDYPGFMKTVFAEGGRLVQALSEQAVVAIAVWRSYPTTYAGRVFVVDDLVTDEKFRSRGIGKMLMHRLEKRAYDLGCTAIHLDSAVGRAEAHAFYFREGMHVSGFHFSKPAGYH